VQNLPLKTSFQALDFNCLHILHFLKAEIDQKSKIRFPKIAKMAFEELLRSQKWISCKI